MRIQHNARYLAGLVVVSACTIAAIPCLAQSRPSDKAPTLVANKAIQDAIDGLSDPNGKDDWKTRFEKLKQIGGADYCDLLPQLLYRVINARDMMEAMSVGVIIQELGITDRQLVNALWPYLGSDDTKVRSQTRDFLGGTEDGSAFRPPDFSIYQAILEGKRQRHEPVPGSLVSYMYERNPGIAVLTCVLVYHRDLQQSGRSVWWAEHVVSDVLWKQKYRFLKRDEIEPAAAEQLDILSRHDGWWARLYVAEIMRQHPEFRVDQTVQRLANDKNELVRQVAAALKEPATKESKPGAADGEKTAPATDLPAAK